MMRTVLTKKTNNLKTKKTSSKMRVNKMASKKVIFRITNLVLPNSMEIKRTKMRRVDKISMKSSKTKNN